jgi:hypothetical protein
MSNNKHWENCIKKAVKMDIDSHVLPDAEKMWQRIEDTVELFASLQTQKKPVRKPFFKIAAVLVTLLLTITVIGSTRVGEALPFGWVFGELRKFATGDQVLVQFKLGDDAAPASPMPPPPPFEIEEIEVYKTNVTEITIDELLAVYPGVLYYPHTIDENNLRTASYVQFGDMWNILMDFHYKRADILLSQRDILGEVAAGIGYGPDTEVSFHRLDGVEYMVAELRYGMVDIKWSKDKKLFDMTSNLTVEEALSVAQSVSPYQP